MKKLRLLREITSILKIGIVIPLSNNKMRDTNEPMTNEPVNQLSFENNYIRPLAHDHL
ncbi:hypothetical protein HDC90_000613 [Pedobacter sp. AK013]|nr:hypothetical protein [Pedobacter sp. AK013]